ncbi:MAG: efflux RND transporter periplasmic adaptor subunit [Polyangiaceae bacterium]
MSGSGTEPVVATSGPRRALLASVIVVGAIAAMALGSAMMLRAEARTNKVALAASPRPVSYVRAKEAQYRASRSYVGTLRSWVEANVGPQLVSAYVDAVLVRPGARVKRGDVLATLDCRNASTASSAIALEARAIETRQKAIEDEARRTQRLLDGGFASPNEVEQILAQSASQAAQLEAQRATLAHSSLEVGDCVLRAPFDGEVGDRFVDPGAFVRPGTAIVSVVDRTTVRFSADVPEVDFAVVAPNTAVHIHVDASGQSVEGTIARRAPHADRDVRTVHFEVDIPNPDRAIPVDTTGEVSIAFGDTLPATEIPLYAATVRNGRATVFTVDGGRAHAQTVRVLGESGGTLLVDRTLAPGSDVVTEGRALLTDGDLVKGTEEPTAVAIPPAASVTPEAKR